MVLDGVEALERKDIMLKQGLRLFPYEHSHVTTSPKVEHVKYTYGLINVT